MKLIYLLPYARLIEEFKNYPVEEQTKVLQAGRESCWEAVEVSQKLNDQSCEALFVATMANGFVEIGRFDRASQLYNEALGIYRELAKTQPQIYNFFVAKTLNNLGNVQSELRELTAALISYNEVLDIYRELAKIQPQIYNPGVAMTLTNLGAVQIDFREWAAARIYLEEALGMFRELAKTQPFYNSFVAKTLNNLGSLEIHLDNYKSALTYFKEAQNLTEEILEKLIDINRRKDVFQEFLNVYNGLLFCYIKLGKWSEALEIAEQGKSRSVADLLSLKVIRPKNPNNLPELDDLANQYEQATAKAQQFESRLLALYESQGTIPKPSNDSDSNEFLKYQNNVLNFDQTIENVRNQQRENINAKDEILVKIQNYDDAFPPKTELLKQNEIYNLSAVTGRTIVLFRVTDIGTYVFIVYPDGTLEHLKKDKFTTQRLGELTTEWFAPYFNLLNILSVKNVVHMTSLEAFINGMNPILSIIYKELIKDVHDKLKAKNIKDVLFVPSGDLAIFPLHACCWMENKKLRYLIDDEIVNGKTIKGLTISYATSVSVFKRAWELKREKQEKFLFITNPDQSLRFADGEVDGIMQTFDVDKEDLRHKKAVKQKVKDEMQNGHSIYHFSCHGNYDRRDAYDSALTLADGEITLKEIMETSLGNAWLTTLSACETGLVNSKEISDEHYGFPLGFVFAGCPSVWGTLWSVRDDATSALMKLAYENIKLEIDKPEALRLAQIELKKSEKFNSPYYWAGFQHYGV